MTAVRVYGREFFRGYKRRQKKHISLGTDKYALYLMKYCTVVNEAEALQ